MFDSRFSSLLPRSDPNGMRKQYHTAKTIKLAYCTFVWPVIGVGWSLFAICCGYKICVENAHHDDDRKIFLLSQITKEMVDISNIIFITMHAFIFGLILLRSHYYLPFVVVDGCTNPKNGYVNDLLEHV